MLRGSWYDSYHSTLNFFAQRLGLLFDCQKSAGRCALLVDYGGVVRPFSRALCFLSETSEMILPERKQTITREQKLEI